MTTFNKVFGIGMSKTGTTTLGKCFEILGLTPHLAARVDLKAAVAAGDIQSVVEVARPYRSIEDTPWYHLYRELDAAYPNSKFILTVRRDKNVHANSSWYHRVPSHRTGEPTTDYVKDKKQKYATHNQQVREYFAKRPDDFIELCWEKGDGWPELCQFLSFDIPDVPIPHANKGNYSGNNSLRGVFKKIIKRKR